MNQFTWDPKSYLLDGERKFLVSGEFHYFRVPKEDWKKRLLLLREAGGNCVATYIPWILHEPVEGDIRFGDIPQRDLESFLQLCGRLNFLVVCRPGPYQYSELKYDGLPGWLCDGYPELLARNIKGEIFRGSSVSYLHPTFLKKVKTWFDVVCPLLARYMVSKGGPVAMVQIDNELMGIHEWFGGWDYNPETMGFGTETGRYASFLKEKYIDVMALNVAYTSTYTSISEVDPTEEVESGWMGNVRKIKDYQDFYFLTIAEYVRTLYKWIRESGINCQIVHNSANPNMNAFFLETIREMGSDFLLGSDHYYNLNQEWNQNNPTPQYAVNIYYSNEMLRLMGYPATIFELPGGSFSDWPPVTKEDTLCCYLTNTALGMKGSNYYIFTGGPNPEGVSHHGDIYDYGASVGAFGEIRPSYESQKTYGRFLDENAWMSGAERVPDFFIGMDWEQARSKTYFAGKSDIGFSNTDAWAFLRKGVLTTAFCASLSGNLLDLSNLSFQESDMKSDEENEAKIIENTEVQAKSATGGLPLFIATSACMSEQIQKSLIHFVKCGGKLLLAPVIPQLDDNFKPCTMLRDFLGAGESKLFTKTSPVLSVGPVHNILVTGSLWENTLRPAQARLIASEEVTGTELGWKMDFAGGGTVIWLGLQWMHSKHEHTDMLRFLLNELGCDNPAVHCDNPNVWTSLRSDGERQMLFVMNLLSANMSAEIEVRLRNGEYYKAEPMKLKPMEVKTLEIGEKLSQ